MSAPAHEAVIEWACDDCGAVVEVAGGRLPVGWRPWVTPEHACSEEVLCGGCWHERAGGIDLARTGAGLPTGDHPWAA